MPVRLGRRWRLAALQSTSLRVLHGEAARGGYDACGDDAVLVRAARQPQQGRARQQLQAAESWARMAWSTLRLVGRLFPVHFPSLLDCPLSCYWTASWSSPSRHLLQFRRSDSAPSRQLKSSGLKRQVFLSGSQHPFQRFQFGVVQILPRDCPATGVPNHKEMQILLIDALVTEPAQMVRMLETPVILAPLELEFVFGFTETLPFQRLGRIESAR